MSNKKELLWASRFNEPFDEGALKFSSSVHVDGKLFREDIQGSIAHATMLGEEGIITREDARQITTGLNEIEKEIESGTLVPQWEDEDIHTVIENRLKEKIGAVAGKLHSGRSRNDQVATDTRLYMRAKVNELHTSLTGLMETLVERADTYQSSIIFGYTHLQRAQPISAGHYYLAYFNMFRRDRQRLSDLMQRVNISPLGAAAFAGSTLPLNAERSAELLGFNSIFSNSIDAVSDRDILIEFISACSIIMMHLSRFCEDIILWSSYEFGYLEISDAFSTGSSIMPQKKKRRHRRTDKRQNRKGLRGPHGHAHHHERAPPLLQPGHAGGQAAFVRQCRNRHFKRNAFQPDAPAHTPQGRPAQRAHSKRPQPRHGDCRIPGKKGYPLP